MAFIADFSRGASSGLIHVLRSLDNHVALSVLNNPFYESVISLTLQPKTPQGFVGLGFES